MIEIKLLNGKTILIDPKKIAAVSSDLFDNTHVYLTGINTPLEVNIGYEEFCLKLKLKNEKKD